MSVSLCEYVILIEHALQHKCLQRTCWNRLLLSVQHRHVPRNESSWPVDVLLTLVHILAYNLATLLQSEQAEL